MPDAEVKSQTAIIYWLWINSGTCDASSAASANWRWSPSSRASPRTAAFTAKRITTGEGKHAKTHSVTFVGFCPFSFFFYAREQLHDAVDIKGYKNCSRPVAHGAC